MERQHDALPSSAVSVAPADWRNLQALLDRNSTIRLQPGSDYRKASGIILRSNQAIYGAAGTRIGRIIVAPGTHNAVLSGVIPDALEFPPSGEATRFNCFERFAARYTSQEPLSLANVVVRDNLFLDTGRVLVDTSRGGAVRNNRFIRTLVHGEAPVIRIEGPRGRGSDRNTFLWINALGPEGDGIQVLRQQEVNFVAFDAEGWNKRELAHDPAMMTVVDSGIVRTFFAHGGDNRPQPGRYMHIEADSFMLAGLRLYRAADPAILIGGSVRSYTELFANGAEPKPLGEAASLIAFRADSRDVTLQGEVRTDADDAAMPASRPWEAARFPPVPDPAGLDWQAQRRTARDDTPAIQAMIDRDGIALLPAGVFHIARSLELRNGQGIVGAGAGRTVLVATNRGVDILVGADHYPDPRPTTFSLIDITLQGGRAGIRHDAAGSGSGAQYNLLHLSHVVFRDMAEAGVVLDGIYGWDNNLLDNLTFQDMPVGILQIHNPRYIDAAISGDVAGMNYMDKNVCYRCRFLSVGTAMKLMAKRANGLNACINCRFEGVRNTAIEMINNVSMLVANSDFILSDGAAAIRSNFPVGIVGSRFVTRGGISPVLDSDAICEGCVFEGRARGNVPLAEVGRRVVLMHSRARHLNPDNGATLLAIESDMGPTPRPFRSGVWVPAGFRQLQGGSPRTAPRLLVDWIDP
jgi:hypothetical protein